MNRKTITLTLARDPEAPEGREDCGYEFVAPLSADGHIDPAGWRKHRTQCRVRRFWSSEDDEQGHLTHNRGRTWAFHYDINGDADDDEPGYKFDDHVFRQGEYVSIREHGGRMRTFKVVSVTPLRITSPS